MRSAILFRMLARSAAEVRPQARLAPCAASSARLDVLCGGAGDLGERLAGDRGDGSRSSCPSRRHPLAADEVAVAALDGDQAVGLPRGCVMRHRCVPFLRCWSSGRIRRAGPPDDLLGAKLVAATLQPRCSALSARTAGGLPAARAVGHGRARRRGARPSPRPAGRSGERGGSSAHWRCHISRSSAPHRALRPGDHSSCPPEASTAARSQPCSCSRSLATPGASRVRQQRAAVQPQRRRDVARRRAGPRPPPSPRSTSQHSR